MSSDDAQGGPLSVDLGVLSDVGRTRLVNEDTIRTYAEDEHAAKGARLFIVADGVGGESFGEVASEVGAETIGEVFYAGLALNPEAPLAEILRESLTEANRRVFAAAQSRNAAHHMATTVVAVALRGYELTIAWVGDSRIYRLPAGSSTLTQITQDHSRVQEQVRMGTLTEEEAAVHPQRNVLSRSIGGHPDVVVDVGAMAVQDGDVIVMCSDGLTGHVGDDEIAQIVLRTNDSARATRDLVSLANARGGRDNISVIVLHIGPRGEAPTFEQDTDPVEDDTDDGLSVPTQPDGFEQVTMPSRERVQADPSLTSPPTIPSSSRVTMADPDIAPMPAPADPYATYVPRSSGNWRYIAAGVAVLAAAVAILLAYLLLLSGDDDSDDPPPTQTTAAVGLVQPGDQPAAEGEGEAEGPSPTATTVPPTATTVPPTATTVPPTATTVPPTATTVPPTATTVPPPTATPIPRTPISVDAGISYPAADWADGTVLRPNAETVVYRRSDRSGQSWTVKPDDRLTVIQPPDGDSPIEREDGTWWWFVRVQIGGSDLGAGWVAQTDVSPQT